MTKAIKMMSHPLAIILSASWSSRTFATRSNSLPFPNNPNATPHQIFHLPPNASQKEIKERYIDLVRLYHPDVVGSSVSSHVAHARFRAITAAYKSLRSHSPSEAKAGQEREGMTAAAAKARHIYRRKKLYHSSDERWKDRVIFGGVILAVGTFVAQMYYIRRQALAEMREEERHQQHLRVPFPTQDSRLSKDSNSGTSK